MADNDVAMKPESQDEASISSRIGHVRWTICAMVFAATSINYMDRQVLSLLKPTLQQSIGLTEVSYGYIVDAFQVAYALGLVLAGRMIDRVGVRLGYCIVMGIWSISAMGHALANTAMEFGIARFFLGIGEAGNFPAAIKTVADWFPQNERSLATGIFNSGTNVGAVLAPLIVPWVALHYSWRAAFLITGIFSMIWIAWWYSNYAGPGEHRKVMRAELAHIRQDAAEQAESKIAWARLLGYRQTWAFAIGKFLTDPIWWFYLFWLPSYFSSKFHLNLSHLGLPLIIVYNASAIGSIAGGWLPVPFRKLGMSPAGARLTAMLVCACTMLPIFTVGWLSSEWAAIALLSLATGAHQGWSANLFTTTSDMFPRSAVGAVVGIGGMAGSIGGVLFATTAGWTLQMTGSYIPLFIISSSAYVLALFFIYLLAPGLRRVEVA